MGASPFILNTQCVAVSRHGVGESAEDPGTLFPTTKWKSGVVN